MRNRAAGRDLGGSLRLVLAVGVAGGVMSLCALEAAGRPAARTAPVQRSRPREVWDPAATSAFYDDAFSVLRGPRPAFGSRPIATGQQGAEGSSSPSAVPLKAGGFAWSSVISEGTLTDEVKDRKGEVAAAIARPSDFKGGGYNDARTAFSSIAMAFAVIAAYDQDIRWKKDAVTARDLFARVGFNCKVGTDQSYNESKARAADLDSLLDGGSPDGKADRDEDFLWSQVAGRPALMKRLDAADKIVAAATASKADFDRQVDEFFHEAEIVAAIGEMIRQPDFEYHDDDTYLGYAATMRDAAIKAREAASKKDYEAARAAAGELKKSCDACHGDYRS